MERYEPEQIEKKWQAVWEGEQAFVVPNPERPEEHEEAHKPTSSRCCRTPPASCTWGMSSTTRSATCSRTSAGAAGWTFSVRWATTRSACRPRTRRSARAATRALITERNIAAIREQMQRMGWAIDWSREVSTADPDYYRWTQWLFLRFLEAGSPTAGRRRSSGARRPDRPCERAGDRRPLRALRRRGGGTSLEQWFFRITDVRRRAARRDGLLESWPERVLTMQRNWIGRSEGAEVASASRSSTSTCRSSRPGLTRSSARPFLSSRPSTRWSPAGRRDKARSRRSGLRTPSAAESAVERADADSEKTGVFTGRYVDEPGERRAHPDLGRRLCADRLRDGRDHGRAGP